MSTVLEKEIEAGFVEVYMDDILIHSLKTAEHLLHAQIVSNRLHEVLLKVKIPKCDFAKRKITFLGHEIEDRILRPSKKKVDALLPTTLKQLQSLLKSSEFLQEACQKLRQSIDFAYRPNKESPSKRQER